MRSFTNRKGESVNVSKEHLDRAVNIKIELQKASPSRRCSWAKLARLMHEDGFDEAENSENYRCLIKDYQESIGKLPSAEKYSNMVADGKIESIKGLVGELAYRKRDAQNEFRKLNRVKRNVIDKTLFIEEIANAFKNHDFSHLHYRYKPVDSKDKKMIVCLSDLHIGALVDLDVNKYNFEIAKKRLYEYLNQVVTDAKDNNITDIYLVGLGDMIEHPYMHNLAYNCEFTLSEQITMASDVVISFIMGLINSDLNVTYAGVAGNHDRFHEDKNRNLDGDHAVKGINKAVESFIHNAKIERAKYVQAKDYEHTFTINGLNILAIHGDLSGRADVGIMSKYSNKNGVDYDLVLMGHYHTVQILEVGYNKFIAVGGSIKGADSYSVNKLQKQSAPSQMYVIINEDGKMNIKWATLN